MKVEKKNGLFYTGLVLLIIYFLLVPVSEVNMKIEAFFCILVSLCIVIKSKNSIPLIVAMLFVTYCVYSIAIGEYIVGGDLGIPLTQVKNVNIYGSTLRILFFFLCLLLAFFPKIEQIRIPKPKDNIVIFSVLIIFLIYIAIFGINRTFANQYTVNISPLYEYAILLFLFAYYFSGNIFLRKVILTLMMLVFIIQDYYYGGRITSMQIILFAISTVFKDFLNKKSAVLVILGGILINSLVGAYRTSFSLNNFSIVRVLGALKNDFFVFDTPVYAYYASATHVASVDLIGISLRERMISFGNFVIAIFFGGENNSGNITRYVNENYFINVGGGLFPTHFYFWFGWIGIIFSALIIVYIFLKISSSKSDLTNLIGVIVISTIPRWFLYNPLTLFRMMLFTCILYFIFNFGHRFIVNAVKGTTM